MTNRFSDKLFGLLVFNYLDENFNINDMGYVEQYGNSFIGTYLQYSNPNNDEASNISQQNYALRMGYDRSYQGFGGGVGATLEYELSFKNSSRLEIECNCTLFRGKDYVETRNYIDSPYLESLGNHELEIEYSTPRTNPIGPGSPGKENQSEVLPDNVAIKTFCLFILTDFAAPLG